MARSSATPPAPPPPAPYDNHIIIVPRDAAPSVQGVSWEQLRERARAGDLGMRYVEFGAGNEPLRRPNTDECSFRCGQHGILRGRPMLVEQRW